MAVDALDKRGVSLTLQLLAETREELHRAEGKAAMLFAIFGIGFGAVLAGIIAGDWKPSDLAAGAEVVWWLGAIAAVVALVAVSAAVWPRLDSDHASGRVTYFAHVVGYRSRDALREAIDRRAEDVGERPLEQLQAISGIVMRKYRLVQVALVLYGVGALACAGAVMVS
jgi:MFS family permease